ncbi:MAG: hypothetical protein IKZ91_03310 [Bacteroidales bacterium]|nr:hypothetical protein [Bacteroidales bacterium]
MKTQNKGDKWAQHLLMTVIGTTISIILTFGTSNIIERGKKKAEGRQLAMMVIHDIDNTAEHFRHMADDEKDSFTKAQYILNHLDKTSDIDADSLNAVLLFVLHESGEDGSFDDSSEQLFLSSQDSWKNINNATFIDAVTEFYQDRRQTFETVRHGIIWEKPIDEDVFYRRQMSSKNYAVDEAEFLSEHLREDRVRYYIECSPARQRAYHQVADAYEMTSKRCKFIMGITDKEMQGYIESKNHPGKRVKAKDLPGKWVLISNADSYQDFEFQENHIIKATVVQHYYDPFFTGRMDVHFTYSGTWELQGDSLIAIISPIYDYSIDTSAVVALPGKSGYVKELVQTWEESVAAQMENSTSEESKRQAYRVALDPSGDRIEMITTSSGAEQEYYISRE